MFYNDILGRIKQSTKALLTMRLHEMVSKISNIIETNFS
jgi:hypothetical protein